MSGFSGTLKRRVFETQTGVVYFAGQGGTLIFSKSFSTVSNAAVVSVAPPTATILLEAAVTSVGLAATVAGTVVTPSGTIVGTTTAANGIKIYVQQVVGTAGVTEFSGTIPSLTLLVEGS